MAFRVLGRGGDLRSGAIEKDGKYRRGEVSEELACCVAVMGSAESMSRINVLTKGAQE